MNRGIAILLISTATLFSFGCHHKKEVQKPAQPVKEQEPVGKEAYVPFTKDLYGRLKSNNLDVRSVQFYNDQQILLSRNVDNYNTEIKSGKVVFKNGKYVNEVLIPAYTPGIIDSIDNDGFRVSFERGNNNFKFINNKYSPEFFIFSGTNWKEGGCDVMFDRMVYRATCGGACSSVSDVKLVVKQSDIDNNKKQSKTLQGVKVGN
jgi:hypothetical protein